MSDKKIKRIIITNSALTDFVRCERLFKYNYVDFIESSLSNKDSMNLGTAVHALLAGTSVPAPLTVYTDQAQALVSAYKAYYGPLGMLWPAGKSELTLSTQLSDRIVFRGTIDLLTDERIIDYKTSSNLDFYLKGREKRNSQLLGYALLAQRELGWSGKILCLDGIGTRPDKFGVYQFRRYETELVQQQVDDCASALRARGERILSLLENNSNFLPAFEKEVCGAYGGCSFGALCDASSLQEREEILQFNYVKKELNESSQKLTIEYEE